MKVVERYDSAFAAELAKGRLKAEGIESCIVNEYLNYVGLPLNRATAPVELCVADEDYELAVNVLATSSNAL
ncbi:MAG: DUF2007 domain-containing protein [Bacteroidales bacterium]|nr:DUF2007 domain-containing protein [Bacteroidales bacterium]